VCFVDAFVYRFLFLIACCFLGFSVFVFLLFLVFFVLSQVPAGRLKYIRFVGTFVYTGGERLPKSLKSFRFNPQVYDSFRQLASRNGYTVTAALEKFMASAVGYGFVFPSAAKTENVEAEARVMLVWLKEGKYWVNLGGGEETSTRGRLLVLLPNVEAVDLRLDIEETLKKKP